MTLTKKQSLRHPKTMHAHTHTYRSSRPPTSRVVRDITILESLEQVYHLLGAQDLLKLGQQNGAFSAAAFPIDGHKHSSHTIDLIQAEPRRALVVLGRRRAAA